jgi:hypothetical protein
MCVMDEALLSCAALHAEITEAPAKRQHSIDKKERIVE